MKRNIFKSFLLIFQIILLFQSGTVIQAQNTKPVRYLNQVFDIIDIQKDIEFGEVTNFAGKTEKLLLDIYAPQNDAEIHRPVILWLHGGGFRPGNDKTQSYIVRIATDFAKRGYVCVSINYRIRTAPKEDQKGTMNDALQDAMSGLNWIRTHGRELGIDKEKIFIGGGSAGGMLAVNFCCKDNSETEKWDKNGIIGYVNLWGSPDPSYMFSVIDKNDPPVITVHGTTDKLVSYENSKALMKQLEMNNIKHELVTIEGGEHTPVGHYDDFVEKIAAFIFRLQTK